MSPLRNIDVPPSKLLPVKEETEISSQSDCAADALKNLKYDGTKETEVVKFMS